MSRATRLAFALSLVAAFAATACTSSKHKTTLLPTKSDPHTKANKDQAANTATGVDTANASGEHPPVVPPPIATGTNSATDGGVTLEPGTPGGGNKPDTSTATTTTTTSDTGTKTSTTDTSTAFDPQEVRAHLARIGTWDGVSDKLPDGSKWLATDAADKP